MALVPHKTKRVAVVGGGISGLAAAHRLLELDPALEVRLFEAGPRVGGVISTLHEHGFQVELSADNFITAAPWGLNLCRRLGLGEQILQTNPTCRRTFVVRRGRLYRLPDGFLMLAPTRLWPLVLTPLLSPWGKLRAACEYFIPPRLDETDESLASFVRRRLGNEVYQRLVEPLAGAVYAADLERLSVSATLVRFREMELEYGSLIRAMRQRMKAAYATPSAKESGARYSMFVTLQGGLSSLVAALAARLPPGSVVLNTPVVGLTRHWSGWQVQTLETWKKLAASPPETGIANVFDGVILAVPAYVAAELLRPLDSRLATDLAGIEHSGAAVISLGFERQQIEHPLDGLGVVVPALENSPLLACSFSSRKYPHRAPAGKELLRAFVGGVRQAELLHLDDEPLLSLVLEELGRLLRIHGQPCYRHIARWPAKMPQYHVGYRWLVERVEARATALGAIRLVGNAYHGIGLPDCIHSGETAAESLLAELKREAPALT